MSAKPLLIVAVIAASSFGATSCAQRDDTATPATASAGPGPIHMPLDDSLESLRKLTPGLPRFGEFVHVTHLPKPVERSRPVYPDSARSHGVTGTVMLEALVLTDGTVGDTYILRSIPDLDTAAAYAVQRWKFSPALDGDKPVAVWVAVPIKFEPQ